MNRRDMIASTGIAVLGATAARAADPVPSGGHKLDGVLRVSVEELAAANRKEGLHWQFIGRRIEFMAVVLSVGPAPRVRIEGMDKGKFDKAVLHSGGSDNTLKVGQRLKVTGLLLDQWYEVWQVWRYDWSLVDAEPGAAVDPPAKPGVPLS